MQNLAVYFLLQSRVSKSLLLEAAIFRVSGFDCHNAIENKVSNIPLLKVASAERLLIFTLSLHGTFRILCYPNLRHLDPLTRPPCIFANKTHLRNRSIPLLHLHPTRTVLPWLWHQILWDATLWYAVLGLLPWRIPKPSTNTPSSTHAHLEYYRSHPALTLWEGRTAAL